MNRFPVCLSVSALMLCATSLLYGMTDQEAAKASASAQMESRKHAAVLDCRLDASTDSGKKEWKSSYGSYSESRVSSKRYVVKISNLESTTNDYTVCWSFVGRDAEERTDSVIERGEKQVTIPPKSSVEFYVESDEYAGRKSVYKVAKEKRESGIKVIGLVVQLTKDDKVIRTWVSSQPWKIRSWLLPFKLR